VNISLTAEVERLVSDKIKSGMYETASEVVREGLRLLLERDQKLDALRAEVRAGFEAVESGQFADYDGADVTELLNRVTARGCKRLAEEKLNTGAP
jgi:antitoxin ParD1/3/4